MTETATILLLVVLLIVVFSFKAQLEGKLNEVMTQLQKITAEQQRVRQEAADMKYAEQEPARQKAAFLRRVDELISEFKENGASQWIIDIAEASRRVALIEFAEQEKKPQS